MSHSALINLHASIVDWFDAIFILKIRITTMFFNEVRDDFKLSMAVVT